MTETTSMHLRKNDRIVFVGDSITEQQLYTNDVENYLAARFPEMGFTFLNAGWGGDTATGGVDRLDRDVIALRPTLVTICYGMNDGQYVAPVDAIRENYVEAMRTLVARLKAAGARVVLLTPGMADETAAPNLALVDYNRSGLRILADEVLTLAARESLPVADLHKLMNEVDRRAKAANPKFCMIPDGVHPDPAGHLVMAFGLLQALGVPPRREEVSVDFAARQVKASSGIKATRLRKSAYGFTLDLRLDRLPFFVEPAARKVLPFLPFQQTYNELRFRVLGLPAARGYFRSQITRSASLSREELTDGVDLATQWTLSVVQQAEQVYRYTLEKDQVYFKIWRMLALNGLNSAFYNARAHAAGCKVVPVLERGRAALMKGRSALSCRLNLVLTDQPGEPLTDGDFISQWSLRGPFPTPYSADRMGGEAAFSASLPVAAGDWLPCDLDLANPGGNLIQAFGAQVDCFAYALTLIESPVAQACELLIGSDDGVAVWLNGESVWRNLDVSRGITADQDRMPIRLRAGANVVLLKITQGLGGWGFCARFNGLQRPVAALRPGTQG